MQSCIDNDIYISYDIHENQLDRTTFIYIHTHTIRLIIGTHITYLYKNNTTMNGIIPN